MHFNYLNKLCKGYIIPIGHIKKLRFIATVSLDHMPLSWKGLIRLGFNTVPFVSSVPVSLLNALARRALKAMVSGTDIVLYGPRN